MGTARGASKDGARSKKKKYKRAVWLSNRDKDMDQIQDEMEKAQQEPGEAQASIPYDDDLPGGGQFFCVETGQHFINAKALSDHKKTKYYKRRIKELKKKDKYTQDVADWAAGMTKEVLPAPVHADKRK
jgi:bud site selection protein 20